MEDLQFGTGAWESKDLLVAAAVVSVTGLLIFLISRITGARQGQSYCLPPGPKGWPLLGALPYVGAFPHKSLDDLSRKYGPAMYMRLGATPLLVISTAEMAKELYQKQELQFASRPPLLVPYYLSCGLQNISFAPYGQHWRQARKGHLKDEVLNTAHAALEQSHSECGSGTKVNLSSLFNAMAMNVITRMMWNQRHRSVKGGKSHLQHYDKFERLINELMALTGADNIADFLPRSLQSAAMKLTGLEKRIQNIYEKFDEFFESLISEREQVLSKDTTAAAAAPADEDDFLDVMLKLMNQSKDSEGLSRDSMKAILGDMTVAGTDTSAVALDWIFSELMVHPEMMKKVQDELTRVVGEHRLVSETDIPHLRYLNAVVREALRHHTPGPLIFRFARTDSKIGGYDVPVSSWVFINVYAIHHDPTIWEDPFDFNPDRFLQSKIDYKGQNFELLPFGSGRRICLGLNLASTLIHMAAAQLLHTMNWSLPEGQKPADLDMSERFGIVVSRANHLGLVAKPRLAHHVIYPAAAHKSSLKF